MKQPEKLPGLIVTPGDVWNMPRDLVGDGLCEVVGSGGVISGRLRSSLKIGIAHVLPGGELCGCCDVTVSFPIYGQWRLAKAVCGTGMCLFEAPKTSPTRSYRIQRWLADWERLHGSNESQMQMVLLDTC